MVTPPPPKLHQFEHLPSLPVQIMGIFCYFCACRKCGYRSLLASEIVQLLCIVPVFFDFIGKDPGNTMIGNKNVSDKKISIISDEYK